MWVDETTINDNVVSSSLLSRVPSSLREAINNNSLSKMDDGVALIALLSFCLMPCKFQSSQQ